MCVCVTDPSLEGDPDLGLVGDEANRGAEHLVLGALDGVGLNADHLPADLFKGQDLEQTGMRRSMKRWITQHPGSLLNIRDDRIVTSPR